MPLQLSFLEEDDIPALAAVDAAAMAGWSVTQAIQNCLPVGETRQEWVEKHTRYGFHNESESVWLKITNSETGELVSAALWRFHLQPEEEKPRAKKDALASASEVLGTDETEEAKAAKRKEAEGEIPGVFVEMGRMTKNFTEEFIGNTPYLSKENLPRRNHW